MLATVAEGDAEDIQRAVEAARRAFDGGQQHLEEYLNTQAVWIKTD